MMLPLRKLSKNIALIVAVLSGCCSSFCADDNHDISVAPASIDFGNQIVNTSAQSTITLTNSGLNVLQIQNVTLSGPSAFSLTGWAGETALQSSESLQLGVIFNPTAQNNYAATLTIYSNVSVDPVVTLSGVGVVPSVSVSPVSATLQAGTSQQFSASVIGTANPAINWLVNGGLGGNSLVGTISSNGLYTAPSNVSLNSSFVVTAADAAYPASQANASVTVMPPPSAVSVSISPISASLQVGQSQQFTATVSGTPNTAVNWLAAGILGGNSSVGTISSTGLYTAPSSVAANTITVTAQSAYQSSSTANAVVAITPSTTTLGHSVGLSWIASTVAEYNIYRGNQSGGPYTKINSASVTSTVYTDPTVQAGQTYYYVTTAVNSTGVESAYSNEVQAIIPTP